MNWWRKLTNQDELERLKTVLEVQARNHYEHVKDLSEKVDRLTAAPPEPQPAPQPGPPLTCPQCSGSEAVALFPIWTYAQGGFKSAAGDVVRCARCGHTYAVGLNGTFRWFQQVPAEAAPPPAAAARPQRPAAGADPDGLLVRAGIVPPR